MRANNSINPIIVDKQDALSAIQSGWAVLKTISSPLNPSVDNRSWDLIIYNLNNPGEKRFVKPLKNTIDRTRRFNPQTLELEIRPRLTPRGQDKDTDFTKKTALTLCPPNGMIEVYSPRYGNPIALIFDWRLCERKGDRYIFAENIISDTKPWLWQNNRKKQHPPQAIPLYILQEQLRNLKKGEIAKQNEILGGLGRKAALAIATFENTIFMRVNALSKKILMLEKSSIDLPIFMVDKDRGILEYTISMQKSDLTEILAEHYPEPIKELASHCLSRLELDLNSLKIDSIQIERTEVLISQQQLQFIAKDIRRYILSFFDFHRLLMLQQTIHPNSKFALLRLRADITWVIKKYGLIYLQKFIAFDKSTDPISYKNLLTIFRESFPEIKLRGNLSWDLPILLLAGKKSELDSRIQHYHCKDSYDLRLYFDLYLFGLIQKLPSQLLWQSISKGEPEDCLFALAHITEAPMINRMSFVTEKYYSSEEMQSRDYLFLNETVLMKALSSQPLEVINKIISRWPNQVKTAIQTLDTLYVFALKHGDSNRFILHYDPKEIKKSWETLVKARLTSVQINTLSVTMKKIAVNSILGEIKVACSWSQILSLYYHYVDSPILNFRRNPRLDNFFSFFRRSPLKPLYTYSKTLVLFALQERAYQLFGNINYEESAKEILNSDLFSLEHFRNGVTGDIRDAFSDIYRERISKSY